MKKWLLLLILTLNLMACSSSLTLITSVKENVIPGIKRAKQYNNYKFTFSKKGKSHISVDSINVFENNTKYSTKFNLKLDKTAKYLTKIEAEGTYILEVPLRKNYIISETTDTSHINKVIIFYKEDDSSKKIDITEFKNIRKLRR